MVGTLTLSQVKRLTIGTPLYLLGSYNADGTPMKYKVCGGAKLWKTRPSDFQLPVKKGINNAGFITQDNMHMFSMVEPVAIAKSTAKRC
jgi:hypothetical protein